MNTRVLTVAESASLFNFLSREAALTRCIKSKDVYYAHSSSRTFITSAGTDKDLHHFFFFLFPEFHS